MQRSTEALAMNDRPSAGATVPRSYVRAPVEIRRLTYGDLPDVIAVERRAFPAPWSLAMFVLELSKPTSI